MDGLVTEDPAKNTTDDPAKNTTNDGAAASSITRVEPKAKAAPTQAELDSWAKRPSDEKLRLMVEAQMIIRWNASDAQSWPLWSSGTTNALNTNKKLAEQFY